MTRAEGATGKHGDRKDKDRGFKNFQYFLWHFYQFPPGGFWGPWHHHVCPRLRPPSLFMFLHPCQPPNYYPWPPHSVHTKDQSLTRPPDEHSRWFHIPLTLLRCSNSTPAPLCGLRWTNKALNKSNVSGDYKVERFFCPFSLQLSHPLLLYTQSRSGCHLEYIYCSFREPIRYHKSVSFFPQQTHRHKLYKEIIPCSSCL